MSERQSAIERRQTISRDLYPILIGLKEKREVGGMCYEKREIRELFHKLKESNSDPLQFIEDFLDCIGEFIISEFGAKSSEMSSWYKGEGSSFLLKLLLADSILQNPISPEAKKRIAIEVRGKIKMY